VPYVTIATPPFPTIDQFDAVCAQFGGEPDGQHARYAGMVDGKPRVVAVWESKAAADRFLTEVLRPAIAGAIGPDAGRPEVLAFDALRSKVREPASAGQ
jgi:hypothetical protein